MKYVLIRYLDAVRGLYLARKFDNYDSRIQYEADLSATYYCLKKLTGVSLDYEFYGNDYYSITANGLFIYDSKYDDEINIDKIIEKLVYYNIINPAVA